MTHVVNTHPAFDQLAAFGVGRLDDAESAAIEVHLAECHDCCEWLRQSSTDDSYVRLLRDATTAGAVVTEAAMETPSKQAAVEPNETSIPAALADHPRYQVLRWIGQGGMGTVFEAEHRLMRRRVALKIIKPQWLGHPAAISRFRSEVQTAARLVHPHVVTAFDAEQAGDVHFLAMEFVEGTTLAQLVAQHGPLPVELACECVRQAALGLQFAHEQGLVHRDIKPGNLMVSAELGARSAEWQTSHSALRVSRSTLSLKILDFGLARFRSELNDQGHDTLAGTLLGTPDFMAPEQARDARTADIRSDIYSLGCTLFFLLTGRVPHPGSGTAVEKALAHIDHDVEPLANFRDDIPAGLQDILDRMLAKKPADRFSTPAEVATALERLGKPASAMSLAAEPTVHRPLTEGIRRVLMATGLVGFVLLMAVIVHVVTDKGDLRVRSEFTPLRLVLRQNGQDVRVIDVPAGTTTARLLAGEYDLELRPPTTTRSVSPKSVKIERGRTSEVSILGGIE